MEVPIKDKGSTKAQTKSVAPPMTQLWTLLGHYCVNHKMNHSIYELKLNSILTTKILSHLLITVIYIQELILHLGRILIDPLKHWEVKTQIHSHTHLQQLLLCQTLEGQ